MERNSVQLSKNWPNCCPGVRKAVKYASLSSTSSLGAAKKFSHSQSFYFLSMGHNSSMSPPVSKQGRMADRIQLMPVQIHALPANCRLIALQNIFGCQTGDIQCLIGSGYFFALRSLLWVTGFVDTTDMYHIFWSVGQHITLVAVRKAVYNLGTICGWLLLAHVGSSRPPTHHQFKNRLLPHTALNYSKALISRGQSRSFRWPLAFWYWDLFDFP